MSKRTVSTFLAALLTAMMFGMRDATGMAPPPPLFVTEEIHWLSPELDGDPDTSVSFADPDSSEATEAVDVPPAVEREPVSSAWRWLARIMGRDV